MPPQRSLKDEGQEALFSRPFAIPESMIVFKASNRDTNYELFRQIIKKIEENRIRDLTEKEKATFIGFD